MAGHAHPDLQAACQDGVALLDKLTSVCQQKYGACGPLSSYYLSNCNSVIFTWSHKGGFVAGYRGGHGFALAKLFPTQPNMPTRWSAPLFLSLNVGEIGLMMGYEKVESFMVAMSDKTLKRLTEGKHTVLGVDQSMVAFVPQIENKSDVIATSNLEADILSVCHSSGFMVDFSLATGSIGANKNKNHSVYGRDVSYASILSGGVPPPDELASLYKRLNDMVECGKSPCPSRTSASLERMTAGFDPDRRIMTMPADTPTIPDTPAREGVVAQTHPIQA